MEITDRVELRCPLPTGRLFAVVRQNGDPRRVTDGNLLEVACRECRAQVTKTDGRKPQFVFHRFNIGGELVESAIQFDSGEEIVQYPREEKP